MERALVINVTLPAAIISVGLKVTGHIYRLAIEPQVAVETWIAEFDGLLSRHGHPGLSPDESATVRDMCDRLAPEREAAARRLAENDADLQRKNDDMVAAVRESQAARAAAEDQRIANLVAEKVSEIMGAK